MARPRSHGMRLALGLALALASSGCIAASVRAHTGVVAGDHARGVQAGVSLAIGIAGKRSAVIETIGVAAGQAPKVGLAVGLDYLRLPAERRDRGIGWRVGFGGVPIAYEGRGSVGVRVASLFILRDRAHSESPEKCCFSSSSRTVAAIGVEAMVGLFSHPTLDPDKPEQAPGGSASLTFELYSLNRMW